MGVPTYHKRLLVTDAAVNIFPTLDDKRDIIQNAIDLSSEVIMLPTTEAASLRAGNGE